MTFSILKIIGIAFGLLMVYATFLNYKKKDFSRVQFAFWELIWASMILVVFFTDFATEAVKAIGFIRVMDFLTVAGFIVVIILSFYNYSVLNKLKNNLEKKIREDALRNIKK